MSGYHIHPATWRDVVAIRRLECAVFPTDVYPWAEILALLVFPGVVNFKAVTPEHNLVGHVAGDPRHDFSWIVTLAVDPAHHRQGLGRRLLRACEDALPTPTLRLTVRESNTPAIALYRKAGYRRKETWPGYYRDGETGIIMEKIRG